MTLLLLCFGNPSAAGLGAVMMNLLVPFAALGNLPRMRRVRAAGAYLLLNLLLEGCLRVLYSAGLPALPAVLLASAIVVFRYPLVGLFTDDPTVARLSANVMLIVALFQPLQMLSVITSGALRGAGDTKYVARVMLICVAIIRPVLAFSAIKLITQFFTPVYAEAAFAGAAATLTYWLAYEAPEWALLGAWAASLVDMALRMGLVMKRFNGGKWHSIKV